MAHLIDGIVHSGSCTEGSLWLWHGTLVETAGRQFVSLSHFGMPSSSATPPLAGTAGGGVRKAMLHTTFEEHSPFKSHNSQAVESARSARRRLTRASSRTRVGSTKKSGLT